MKRRLNVANETNGMKEERVLLSVAQVNLMNSGWRWKSFCKHLRHMTMPWQIIAIQDFVPDDLVYPFKKIGSHYNIYFERTGPVLDDNHVMHRNAKPLKKVCPLSYKL